jgi:hypothetical protein
MANVMQVLFYPQPFPMIPLVSLVEISRNILPTRVQNTAEAFKGEPLTSLNIFGTPLIILNTHKAVKDVGPLSCRTPLLTERQLFETRGQIYSSRPPMPLLRDVVSRRSNISFEP